jgi:2-keto-3-deoxy-L-rhamnonate aldolase RhmA
MDDNHMILKMRSGRMALGIGVTMPPETQVAGLGARAGFDWAFIDLEHCYLSPASVIANCAVLRAAGVTPLVRIPKSLDGDIGRLLDSGAQGIILPHVETVEEAQDFVTRCKFAPLGRRSWGGASPQLGYPTGPRPELMVTGNDRTLSVVMIESAKGLACIEQIARLPGLDAVMIGNVDLSLDLGEIGRPDGPETRRAIARIGGVANAAGKFFGIAGLSSREAISVLGDIDVNFVLAGIDYRLLGAAFVARAAEWCDTA